MSNQLAPGLLIASPPLGDPNFDRTVILLAIHNEHGALGFVINRVAPLQLGELLGLAGYGEGLGEIRGSVYVGGPVEPSSGWVLGPRDLLEAGSDVDEDGVIEVGDRLVVSSSRKVFDAIARRAREDQASATDSRLIVLLGYSGWGPGQLEGEIAQGAWLPAPIHEHILFDTDADARWERTYAALGLSSLGAIGMRTVGEA